MTAMAKEPGAESAGTGEAAASGPIPERVRVEAPARLHLGFFDLNGGLGRSFGSLGLAISAPILALSLHRAERTSVTGEAAERAARYLAEAARRLGVDEPLALKVDRALPEHQGFGSGTQLALAVVAAVARLAGRPVDLGAAAASFERGARSGIGVSAFVDGGFVVDGGRGPDTVVPPVLARVDFPEDWRLLLIRAPGRAGIHGAAEIAAFSELAPMTAAESGILSRLVLMRLLPGLKEADVGAVGAALTEIQARIGDHFAPAQGGGRFASPSVAAVLEDAAATGAAGIGQTSWGPTGFALYGSEDETLAAMRRLTVRATDLSLSLEIVCGRNHGASVIKS